MPVDETRTTWLSGSKVLVFHNGKTAYPQLILSELAEERASHD